jgi:hypothetical protein
VNLNTDSEQDTEEDKQKPYSVHNDIIFITEYVAIDQEEPIEIIQCYGDIGEGQAEIVLATR